MNKITKPVDFSLMSDFYKFIKEYVTKSVRENMDQ